MGSVTCARRAPQPRPKSLREYSRHRLPFLCAVPVTYTISSTVSLLLPSPSSRPTWSVFPVGRRAQSLFHFLSGKKHSWLRGWPPPQEKVGMCPNTPKITTDQATIQEHEDFARHPYRLFKESDAVRRPMNDGGWRANPMG